MGLNYRYIHVICYAQFVSSIPACLQHQHHVIEEFLLPMDISQNRLAKDIDVSPRRINEIVHGKRAVTADTDLRLSKALGTSEGFWLGLQTDYDLGLVCT